MLLRMTEHKCLTCRFAKWKMTAAGRLHPSWDGRCTWVGKLPRSVTYPYGRGGEPPHGGYISRRPPFPFEDCPTYEPAEAK